MRTNLQKPFSFERKKKLLKTKKPLNLKWTHLPSNYVGMCVYCLLPVQKYQPGDTCRPCGRLGRVSDIVKFTEDLLPWKVIPPNTRDSRISRFLGGDVPFRCTVCGRRYGSVAVFLALCTHKIHSLEVGHMPCRFCCKVQSKKLITAMETAVEEINRDKELNKNKKKSDELTYGATTRQRRVTFGQILTNARPGATPWNFENIRYTNADIRYLDPNTINVVGTALDYDDDNF